MSAPLRDKPEWMKSDPARLARAIKRVRESNAGWIEEKDRHMKDTERAHARRYRKENHEKIREHDHRRRALEMNAPGTFTASDIKLQVKAQTNKKGALICWWCDKPIVSRRSLDHRIPLSKGGSNDPGNIVIVHHACNSRKRDKMPWEYCGRLL